MTVLPPPHDERFRFTVNDLHRELMPGPYAWLVDLNLPCAEVYRRPMAGVRVHSEIQIRPRGESVSPEAFRELVLAVATILG